MSSIVITFDTNFIIENKDKIRTIILDVKKRYELIIAKIVIEEVKGQRVRQTLKSYNNIKDKINAAKKENSWLDIVDNTDIIDVIKEQEKKLDKWLTKAFDEKIIEIDYNDLLATVLERCKYKKPPFNNEENSSDKGFKDTILFLNIIQFMKNSEYDEIYLFTNDKVINKFKNELQNEFFENTNKKLSIVSGNEDELYKILEIDKKESTNETKDENDNEIFPKITPKEKDIREQTKELLSNIFSEFEIVNNWNFVTWKKAEVKDIKIILGDLGQLINKYIFLDKIDINYIFDVQASKGTIKISDLETLSDLYREMNTEEKDALAYAITCKFNSYYQELPF